MLRFAATFLVFGFLIAPGFAQTLTGTLHGRVVDQTRAVLPGATVTAINEGTNFKAIALSNEQGNYSIDLPVGVYRIEGGYPGFKKYVQRPVRVRAAGYRADLIFEPGEITDTLEVLSEEPLLNPDHPAVGVFFSGDIMRQLPINGGSVDAFTLTVPGSVYTVPGSHLNMRGGVNALGVDEHYNLYLFDGLDNGDPLIRNWAFRPPIDQIQDYRFIQAGVPAEFGRSAGAVISVTTKSGTNSWKGSVWEYIRNDDLDARNYFAPAGQPKPAFIRNQFGATFGGPIRENRTFFFATYEGLRLKQGISRRATVPTERMRSGDLSELGFPNVPSSELHPLALEVIQAYPLPDSDGIAGNRISTGSRIENVNDYSIKIDHMLHKSTSLSGRFSSSIAKILDPFRAETGQIINLADFGQTADRTRTSAGISAITTFQKVVNEFRVGYSRVQQAVLPVNPGTAGQVPIMGFEKTFLSYVISAFDTLGSGSEFQRAVNVFNYIDTVAIHTGNHQLKAGVDGRYYQVNSYIISPNTFIFTGLRTGNSMADFLRGLPTLSYSFTGSPGGNARKNELAWFIQDTWKATRRLTVTYGLRWEYYGRITEQTNKQSLWVAECNCMRIAGDGIPPQLVENDYNNFAPRLGLVYRPFDSKTVIKASGGIFYDNDMRHNSEVIMNPPFFQANEFQSMSIPGLSLDNPFPANSGAPTLTPATFDRAYRDTYAAVWTLGIQHEARSRTLLGLTYVGNHIVKARRVRNLNQAVNGVPPFPGFANINAFEQAGNSSFNSLEARVERRFTEGLGLLSAYTWSHTIDDRPGQGGGPVQDSQNLHPERADADFDVRHRWTISLIWDLPFGHNRQWGRQWTALPQALLGGWSLSAIHVAQTGRPLSVTLAASPLGNVFRPNLVPGVDWKPENQGPDNWINRAAFSIATTPGVFGDLPRNTVRGPGVHNIDLALAKTHHVGDDLRLQFRAECFNVLNRANFGPPGTQLDRPSFGIISSTALPERQIQFGVHLDF
jgi:hypothetical protein